MTLPRPLTLRLWFRKSVRAGEPLVVFALAGTARWNRQRTYEFCTNVGHLEPNRGLRNYAVFDTTGLPPGTYKLWGFVEQGNSPWDMAEVKTTFEVVG